MLRKRSVIIVLVLAEVFSAAWATGTANAQSPKLKFPKSFKASFTWQEGNNPPRRGLLYFSHGRIRKEIEPQPGGYETVEIIRPGERKIFEINPNKRLFYVLPWNSRAALISEAVGRRAKRKLVGSETIEEQACDKYQVTPSDTGAAPFYLWVTKDTDFPVQLISRDSDPSRQIRIQWKDLKPGNQAPILFEPPIYFKQVERPSSSGSADASATPAAPVSVKSSPP